MNIIIVQFPHFNQEIREGNLSISNKNIIQNILNTMSYDEYAGYSPNEQAKYTEIKNVLNNYPKPKSKILRRKI